MQKIKEKSGLALGLIVALVSSVFGVVPSASAAPVETAAVIAPTGAGASTANTMIHTETFEMRLRYGTSVAGGNNDAAGSASGTVGDAYIHYVVSSASATAIIHASANTVTALTPSSSLVATSISATAANDGYVQVTSTSAFLNFGLAGLTSLSPAVSITVTPYLESDGTDGLSAGDAAGEAYVINFVPWSGLGATVALAAAVAGDQGATASVTVTEGNIRWSQLNGNFGVYFTSTNDTGTTTSATTTFATGVPLFAGLSGASLSANAYSFSAAVPTAVFTSSQTLSARLVYFPETVSTTVTVATGGLEESGIALDTDAITALGVSAVTISAVTGANVKQTGDSAADARFNSAFQLKVYPYSASATTAVAVASAFTVSAVTSDIEFDRDSGVTLNGTQYTSSARFLAAGFTIPAGTTTVNVATFGQDDDSGTETITFQLSSQLKVDTLVVTLQDLGLTVEYAPTAVAGLAGQAKSFTVDVVDRWSVVPVRTDLRVHASLNLDGSISTAVSPAVAAGKATVEVAPLPATRTGSGTLTLTLQTFNQNTQAWDDGDTDSVEWNVYTYAAGTDAFTARTATASASISYGTAAYSWSGVVTVAIANSFSDIAVSAPGLVIENNDQSSITASDTLTVAANGLSNGFRFASKKAGTYTVTFTNGTATTTSVITIDAAGHDKGASISFDKSSIPSGETSTITGKLVDANGNPVATAGTASIAVTYTGKGLPYGQSTTMQTDANGEFTFQVLVLSTEKGDAAISATYKPTGAASSTRNITYVHALDVGVADSATADQKITVGTFKGYVAIYTKGYMGQKLSAKVAGKWLVVDPIAAYKSNDYSRTVRLTGAGYTIAVDLYIDGAFVRSEVVTTK